MSTFELQKIEQAADTLGISVSQVQAEQLIQYLDTLETWNRTYNLTAVRQRDDMLVQHLFDCLAVVGPLQRSGRLRKGASRPRVLDVGSGGGLPGVVLATMFPHIDVVCVDTVGKKASFVRQVALEVGLRNLYAEHARVEALRATPFDVITSRAFASLSDFVRLTETQLLRGGCWMAMKGVLPEAEITALSSNIQVFHVEQLRVPDLDAERCLVWMQTHTQSPTE